MGPGIPTPRPQKGHGTSIPTDTGENITFPHLPLRAVIMVLLPCNQLDIMKTSFVFEITTSCVIWRLRSESKSESAPLVIFPTETLKLPKSKRSYARILKQHQLV